MLNNSISDLSEPQYGRGKRIRFWRNGDIHNRCYELFLNPNLLRTWNSILIFLTDHINPDFGAVRKVFHVGTGRSVCCFQQLDPREKYVIASIKSKFQPILNGYVTPSEVELRIKKEKRQFYAAEFNAENFQFLEETSKRNLTIIFMLVNGRPCQKPVKIVLRHTDLTFWENTMNFLAKLLDVPDGIQSLYTVFGDIICSPYDLQHGYVYVAVPFGEKFKKIDYLSVFQRIAIKGCYAIALNLRPSSKYTKDSRSNNNSHLKNTKKQKNGSIRTSYQNACPFSYSTEVENPFQRRIEKFCGKSTKYNCGYFAKQPGLSNGNNDPNMRENSSFGSKEKIIRKSDDKETSNGITEKNGRSASNTSSLHKDCGSNGSLKKIRSNSVSEAVNNTQRNSNDLRKSSSLRNEHFSSASFSHRSSDKKKEMESGNHVFTNNVEEGILSNIQIKSSEGRTSPSITNDKLSSSSITPADNRRSSSVHRNNEKEMFGFLSDIVEEVLGSESPKSEQEVSKRNLFKSESDNMEFNKSDPKQIPTVQTPTIQTPTVHPSKEAMKTLVIPSEEIACERLPLIRIENSTSINFCGYSNDCQCIVKSQQNKCCSSKSYVEDPEKYGKKNIKCEKSSWIHSERDTTASKAFKISNIDENCEENKHLLDICERYTQTSSRKPSASEKFLQTEQIASSRNQIVSTNIVNKQIPTNSEYPPEFQKNSRTSWKELRDNKDKVEYSENSQNSSGVPENSNESVKKLSNQCRNCNEKSIQPEETNTKSETFNFDNLEIKCYQRRSRNGNTNDQIERVLKIVSGGSRDSKCHRKSCSSLSCDSIELNQL